MKVVKSQFHAIGFQSYSCLLLFMSMFVVLSIVLREVLSNRKAKHIYMDYTEFSPCEGKKYYLVLIGPFTRWTECFPTTKADTLRVTKALCREIIPRFGIQKVIFSDNESHF